ncbi:MAG: ArnT family glycosyltransferase [Acidimicrobiales bacterium]
MTAPPDVETDPAPHDEAEAVGGDATTHRWFAPGLAGIAAVGLVVRVLYLVGSKVDHRSTFRQGDAFWYSTTATNLGNGKLFVNFFTNVPTADHPPLTVLILGPTSWLFRDSTLAQRLTMVVLGTATIVVIGLGARRLAGPKAGLIAAGVAALHPALWINDVLIMSETPTALIVAGLLWAGIALAERPTTRLVVATGVLCGLAALSRAETGLLLPFMVWPLLLLARQLSWRRRLGLVSAATAVTFAVIAPWTLLNLTRFSEPVPISTSEGLVFSGANCDLTFHGSLIGGWSLDECPTEVFTTLDTRKPPLTRPQRQALATRPKSVACTDHFQLRPPCWDASRISAEHRRVAFRYIRHHLGDLPKVVVARQGRTWGWYRLDQAIGIGTFEGRTRTATRWGYYLTWALFPIVVAGAVVVGRRRRLDLVPFVAALVTVVLVTTAFYGLVRFRLPYDVASCLAVGVAGAALIDRVGNRRRPAA